MAINGEPLAGLDFTGRFIQLAYLQTGIELPDWDPYLIDGLEDYRDGIKLALLISLSRIGPMKLLKPELKALLPVGWAYKNLVAILKEQHPAISHLFGADRGLDLMFSESQILVALLLRLAEIGIHALLMHDGILVPRSRKVEVMLIMQEVSKHQVGVMLPVKEKTIAGLDGAV